MSPDTLFLTLAGSVQAVVLAVYVAVLICFSRAYMRAIGKRAKSVWALRTVRTRANLIVAIGGCMSIGWRVVIGTYAAPLLLLIVPLVLAIGCLEVTAHLITIGGRH